MKRIVFFMMVAVIGLLVIGCTPPVVDEPLAEEPLSDTKAITVFNFTIPSCTGTVTESSHTVTLTVPYGTDLTAIVPTITITGSSVVPASGIAQDFTNPVTYTVTAEDGTTVEYIVTVESALTAVLPVFSTDGQLSSSAARVITDDSGKFSYYDFMFQAYCPALTAFAPASDKNTHGSRYTQYFFNTALDFSVERFTTGINGIETGVRVSSTSITEGVHISVEFDPSTKNFFYEQYFFLDDPDGNIQGPFIGEDAYPINGIFYYTARGNYGEDYLVADIKSAAILDMAYSDDGSVLNYLQIFYDAEQYAGEWNNQGFGRGFISKFYDNTYYYDASSWPVFEGISTPIETQKFSLSDLEITAAYLKRVIGWYEPGNLSFMITQFYTPEGILKSYPIAPDWKWINGVEAPDTFAAAKDNWPCPEWLAVTQLTD